MWLVGYLVVELEGLLDGDVEGGHDDGVGNTGGDDDRSHDAHESWVVHDAKGEDRRVDHAGDEGDNKGADEREQALDLGVGEHGDEQSHDHGGDGLGDQVGALDGGGDLDYHAGEEADNRGLADVGLDDENLEAESRDDELGLEEASGEAAKELGDGHVEDETGGEEDGIESECLEVEFAAVSGLDGAGLGGGVLRHVENPFGRGVQGKSGGA